MNCDKVRECIVLAAYGELPDENSVALELHLTHCTGCVDEWKALEEMGALLAFTPVAEPSPNLVAQSRMRLDEALDAMPRHGWITRLRSNLFGWLGHIQSAPALATLLVGLGFLGGNYTYRYQVAHAPKLHPVVVISNPTTGTVANVSGIVQTPNSNIVEVSYNRVVEEKAQGSLNDPQIRQLLMLGTKAATNNGVRVDSVALLADECKAGRQCKGEEDGGGIRNALLVSLRYDKNPGVRKKALEGLQPYIAQDQHVRDAVLEALMHDSNADVRTHAIDMLQPVQSDSSVRQVLRTVSTTDANPYIRTVSTQALQGSAGIQ
jgi:hypothetical protein